MFGGLKGTTMERKFKSLSLFEFQQRFPDDEACMDYLTELKWPDGFVCPKCGHTRYCQGKTKYQRECTRCRHHCSPTSDTLFHKVKFPILKAFYIVYFTATSKKGIASTELSRKLNLRQKTCWGFKQKVSRAMSSSGLFPLEEEVDVDETVVGEQEEDTRGRANVNKQLVVFGIEKRGKGISRLYGKVISDSSRHELGQFFKEHVSRQANVRTDGWTGYTPLKQDYPRLYQQPSGYKGENFPLIHRAIMSFKGWLRGMHHSVRHLQAYIDEYTYRFNRHFMKEGVFDNLMQRMVARKPAKFAQMGIY